MLSVIVLVRNNRVQAAQCLQSIAHSIAQLFVPAEFIVVDDRSDPDQQVPAMLVEFRRLQEQQQLLNARSVTLLSFLEHQHYTRAMSAALSVAKGSTILFVSHDMLVTPEYVSTLLAVAATRDDIGVVRGTSPYVDCLPQYCLAPPIPARTLEDLGAFAGYIARVNGLSCEENDFLIGDSMLIKRSVITKIGVFDRRYFGYCGDIDYGVRVQRAGFKMVCAKGAWLHHTGAGAYKDLAARSQQDLRVVHERRMRVVNEAYKLFRQKWDTSLPPEYSGLHDLADINFAKLRDGPPPLSDEYVPPLIPEPAICRAL